MGKQAFLSGYRFCVCFENDESPGYCTEKLLHAFAAGCVPIYWGDPRISSQACREEGSVCGDDAADFNPAALISAHDFETPELMIRHIERVDRDPALFETYLRQPILSDGWYRRLGD